MQSNYIPFDVQSALSEAKQIRVNNEDELVDVAQMMAGVAKPDQCWALWGDLGAGKTTFARAFIRELSIESDANISSPTYNLVQIYPAYGFDIWHVDLYRLEQEEELFELGIEDAIGESLCIIEWPQKMGQYLPYPRIDIGFAFDEHDDHARLLTIDGLKFDDLKL
ncbi:MAG: tRNA (adenosine(37)-N6)-threonylcarbamoyltransferase complex ATPase subunit type 1 TsaE [Pseudomonadota bacterium]